MLLIIIALCGIVANAQVSQTVNVTTAGTLSTLASSYLETVTNLTVTGSIDQRDITTMRDAMPKLAVLNLSSASIKAYSTYLANEMPSYSFYKPGDGAKTTLTTINFPSSLTSIGTFAFDGCSGIVGTLSLPTTIKTIAEGAFYNCSGISGTLTFPNALITIGEGAFYNCSGISGTLNLPASLTTLSAYAFNGCTGIATLAIPASLTSISDHAFAYCTSISVIYCLKSTPPTLVANCFYNTTFVTDVFVPTDAAVTAYKATTWYDDFSGTIIKKGTFSAVKDLNYNKINAYASVNGINVNGVGIGESITLYTVNGLKLHTIKSEGKQIFFSVQSKGIYLLKCAQETLKVVF